MNKRRLAIAVSAVAFCCCSMSTAGEPVLVGAKTPENERISMDAVDHSAWDQLLQDYVDEQGRVAYGPWKAATTDVRALDRYLSHLSTASSDAAATREAKLAFWINSYNAVTVRGILREYPTSSIRNHTAKVLGYNIWHDFQLLVGGKPISLDSIEHKVLRKMDEPRIHFAIVCASHSCPKLLNRAYTAAQLEEQLTRNTRDFFANAENFRFRATSQEFRLSAILNWFKEDFGNSKKERLKTIAEWLPERAQSAAREGRVKVAYLPYDWSLNDRETKPQLAAAP